MRYSIRSSNPGKVVRIPRDQATDEDELLSCRAQIRERLEREDFHGARALLDEALKDWPAEPALLRLQRALSPPEVQVVPDQDRDRSAELDWLADLPNIEKFRGKWIALLGAQVVAMADTLKALLAYLGTHPPEGSPLIHKVV